MLRSNDCMLQAIDTFCSFMIGLPFETPQMLAKTIRLADTLNPTSPGNTTRQNGVRRYFLFLKNTIFSSNAILIIHMGLERP